MGLPGKVFTSALLPVVCCMEVSLAETAQSLSALSSWGVFFRLWLEASGSRFAAVLAAEILFWAGTALLKRRRSRRGD